MSKKVPYMMPYEGSDVPHAVLEVNQKCNIVCRACYKSRLDYTKPLEQIKEEVDLLISKRNLNSLTLAGGEPSLHPQLPDIISYITSKGIAVMMLSNGVLLTEERLKSYKSAGLSEIMLHIDTNQERPDIGKVKSELELNSLREEIAKRIHEQGIVASLELTLYKNALDDLPEVINFIRKSEYITRLLITCCNDFSGVMSNFAGDKILETEYGSLKERSYERDSYLIEQSVSVKDVEQTLKNIGMEPYAYIASSHDDNEKRWIFYYSFAITLPNKTVKVLNFSKYFGNVTRKTYNSLKKSGKPYTFAQEYDQLKCVVVCIAYALLSKSFSAFFDTMKFLAYKLIPGSKIRHKGFTFQQGPSASPDGGIVHCKSCPDATIRNGKLVPVCLVDFLYPDTYK